MSQVYNVSMIENGINYTIYFFGGFKGHTHPWTPIQALQIDEIHNGLEKYDSTPYYQGWYAGGPEDARLAKLIKYNLYRKDVDINISLSKIPGVYYHRMEKINDVWTIMEPLSKENIIKQDNYFRYVINNDGQVEFAYHIYPELTWGVEYKYNERGALDKTTIYSDESPNQAVE